MSSGGQSSEVPTSLPVDDWLAELGDSTGAPGGGAASGILLGVAASLFRMVAAYTPDDPAQRHPRVVWSSFAPTRCAQPRPTVRSPRTSERPSGSLRITRIATCESANPRSAPLTPQGESVVSGSN
ncbi:cyclodeaminase/cyclohydrolase family protein [Microbacterium sp. Se5.02b]|nr:cyclodeaminase/cyclohydrolase family protein [Microbacterium sp. Se5.02b]